MALIYTSEFNQSQCFKYEIIPKAAGHEALLHVQFFLLLSIDDIIDILIFIIFHRLLLGSDT